MTGTQQVMFAEEPGRDDSARQRALTQSGPPGRVRQRAGRKRERDRRGEGSVRRAQSDVPPATDDRQLATDFYHDLCAFDDDLARWERERERAQALDWDAKTA